MVPEHVPGSTQPEGSVCSPGPVAPSGDLEPNGGSKCGAAPDPPRQSSAGSTGTGAAYTPPLPRGTVEERGEAVPSLPDFRGSTLPNGEGWVSLAAPSPRQARGVGASRCLIFLRFTSLRDRRPDSLLRAETRKYTSASYHLIHFSRVVIIIVFVP